MTVSEWLQMATADAKRRGLPELVPLLETLAKATQTLREASKEGRDVPHAPADR